MGLLDDAIREHLELKRLRGADPSEVMRQEGEALGPVRHEEDRSVAHAAEPEAPSAGDRRDALGGSEASSEPDLSQVGQETVELDMRTLLETESIEPLSSIEPDLSAPVMSAARSRARAEPPVPAHVSTGDALEWGFPRDGERDFNARHREERPARGIGDTQDTHHMAAGGGLAGAPRPPVGASSQERLWLDRRQAPDFGLDR